MRPSSIALDSTRYLLAQGANAYRIVYESSLVARKVEAGGERGERELARRDLLQWNWTDWGGGEGQEFIDTRRQNSFNKYFVSGGALNIRRPHKVTLGLAAAEDLDLGATTQPPRLVNAGNPVVVYDTSWRVKSGGSWSSANSTGSASNVRGRIAASNGKVFVGTASDVRRLNITAVTNAQWVTTEGNPVVAGDGRIYYIDTGTDSFDIEFRTLASAGATTLIVNQPGFDEVVDLALDGNKLYVLASVDKEKPFIFRGDGTDSTTYTEFARLPDAFFIQNSFRESMVVLNGVVFIGGYFKDPFNNVNDPALIWVTEEGSGVVGRIRERGNSEAIKSLYATIDNEVLMGTTKGNVYAYNMNTGGFYQFASGIDSTDDVVSMTYDDGVFYFATNDTVALATEKVYATKSSGSGKYPSSVKIDGSKWDFDTDARKILLEVAVQGTFPTSTSAEFSFSFDGGSEVTTDSAGATMVANTTGTTVFTISSASVERTGFTLKPFITLKTSDTSATPTVHGVLIKATTFTKTKFIECALDLRQPNSQHPPGDAISGAAASAEIEALIESTSSRIVSFEAQWEKAQPPYSRTVDTYNVIIDEASIETDDPGKAIARLRLRVL